MAGDEKYWISEHETSGYVLVLVARSASEAEHYCQLFSDHDIPATIGDEDETEHFRTPSALPMGGVPVLVAEEMLDEAKEIVADREDVEEFRVVFEEDDLEDDDEDETEEFGIVEELEDDLEDDTSDLLVEDDDYDEDEDDEEF